LDCAIRAGFRGDPSQEPPKDKRVQRKEGIPVGETGESNRIEYCRLAKLAARRACRLDLKLKPGSSWQLHLGDKPHELVFLNGLDTPEVQGIAYCQVAWIASASPHASTTYGEIKQASQLPEPRPRVPSCFASYARNSFEDGARRLRDLHNPRIDDA
jgi:hypothetical protein